MYALSRTKKNAIRRAHHLFAAVGAVFLGAIAPGASRAVEVTVDATSSSPRIVLAGNLVAGGTSMTFDVVPGSYPVTLNPGGNLGVVTIDGAGNFTYAAVLDGTHLTGLGTSTLTIVSYPITLSTTGLSNKATVSGLTNPGIDMVSYSLPIGNYTLQALPGGVLNTSTISDLGLNVMFSVEPSGTVTYDSSLNSVLSGSGTATVTLLGYPITLSTIGLDNKATVLTLGNPFPPAPMVAAGDTVLYTLSVGRYVVQGLPGGNLLSDDLKLADGSAMLGFDVVFLVHEDGTVSYVAGLEGVILEGNGTSTVTLQGSDLTIAGNGLDGTVFIHALDPPSSGKSVTYKVSIGKYQIFGLPGEILDQAESGAKLLVDPDGIATYDADLDGVALSGRETNTIEVLPFTVELDAGDSTTPLNFRGLDPIPAGTKASFQVPIGNLVVGYPLNFGSFKLTADGFCDPTAIDFPGGTAKVRCPRIFDDFKCYKVKDLKNPGFEKISLSLADDVTANVGTFEIKKPFLHCNPTSRDDLRILDADAHLVCYKLKGPKLATEDRPTIEASSDLGVSRLELVKPYLLCVPSTKTVLP